MKNAEKGIKLCFRVSEGEILRSEKEGKRSISVVFSDNTLCAEIFYDVNERPLALRAEAQAGDKIDLLLFPHRIELWRDGVLVDEEWPYGNRLYNMEDKISGDFDLEISEYTRKKEERPSVISSFSGGALGWRPEENVFCGDCMPHYEEGRFHLIYLKDRHHHESKWGLGAHTWSHISTLDFDKWDIHPTAVDIDLPEEASICTGSYIKRGGNHYLYYTVRGTVGGVPAKIRRSVSKDGYHYEKDENYGFTLSEKYRGGGARDPKIFLADDGLYHMIITVALREPRLGVLAHLTSPDLEVWTELSEDIYTSPDEREPECPDYFKLGDYYYLTYCLSGTARYMYSKEPFSGWTVPKEDAIPCGRVPKAAVIDGEALFAGFEPIGAYAGTLIFKKAKAAENGELIFY